MFRRPSEPIAEGAMRGRSIGQRVSMLIAVAVLTAVLMVTAIFAYSDLVKDLAQRKRALEVTGFVFASALADHVEKRDTEEALRVLRSIGRLPEITFAAVLDQNGRAFASFGSTVLTNTALLDAEVGMIEAVRSGTYPVAVDVIKSGARIGQIVLLADVSDILPKVVKTLLASLGVACVAVAVSFALAQQLLSRVTGPIHSLTAAIQDIRATGRYERRVESRADGEAGVLIDSFNAMIGEIQTRGEALEQHRQTLEATVEQRTHELRLARDAAESANEAKSSFLAAMSHEIRTPLNGLMVMAELLAGAGLDQRLQRYAEVIVKSGRSLLTIINDILDLSKIEAGRLDLEQIAVNPAGVADDVTSLFWEKASSKGLDLAARVAPNMPEAVLADPVRLNQILSNLVNNALKFTDSGQVLVSLLYDDGHLTLAVSDSGIGIPQKKLNQLFEAFSQADQTITRKFGGTGLGLAICKRLAEAMGGAIGVRSELARGSTFWVRIPAPVAMPVAVRPQTPFSAAIVFDGLASQSALGTALRAAGATVTIGEAGAPQADVIFAPARKLAELGLASAPRPKVICLGSLGDKDGEAAIAKGLADDLMILPFRQQDIAEMIGRLQTGTLRGLAVLDRRPQEGRALASFRGRHAIVADDNAVNREVLIEVLRQLDVAVDVAVNGREAVELWRARRPDIVFMDCSMPEMDGYSATREIRAHEALALDGGHTPVVALTAHVAGTGGSAWREAGMDAYMTKPFTLAQISDCLAAQLSGRAMQQEMTPAPEPGGQSAGPVLDEQVLAELRTIGGSSALFQRVLELFAAKAPPAMKQVEVFAGAADLKALADAAHALKSMCANIGAHGAVSACHDLERAARSGQSFDLGDKVAAMSGELRRVLGEVQRLRFG